MPISDTDAKTLAKHLAKRMFVDQGATATLTAAQLTDAVAALHDFLESNATAVNQALPLALRSAMTTPQKSFALAVAAMKYGGLI